MPYPPTSSDRTRVLAFLKAAREPMSFSAIVFALGTSRERLRPALDQAVLDGTVIRFGYRDRRTNQSAIGYALFVEA